MCSYRGLRSVDDIYRLQSAHTENYREPGVHCNKKRHQSLPRGVCMIMLSGPPKSESRCSRLQLVVVVQRQPKVVITYAFKVELLNPRF